MKQAFYPGQVPIDAYGNGGFRFADMSHRGSILCMPSGVYAWDTVCDTVAGGDDLNFAGFSLKSLERVIAEADDIEVLLVGTGASQLFLTDELREGLQQRGLFAEAMATGAAARTFNVLLAEKRAVAAALVAVD